MIILKKDMRNGKITAKAQSVDDLWCLSRAISKGDVVTGKTTRKVRLGASEEAVKKTYTLSISVEEVEFKDKSLRVNGATTGQNEDIPKGAHHTITIEQGDVLTIAKTKWPKYQLDRLEQATNEQLKALIIVFDREAALLARLKSSGYEIVAELKGKVKKKGYDTATVTNFYREIIAAAKSYDERNAPDKIILASPAFWKDEMLNELKSDPKAELLKKKISLASCSSVSENAIGEVLKRPEMEAVFKTAEAAKEMRLVEEAMKAIAKGGKVAYGEKEVRKAIEAAAVETLLITDSKVYGSKEAESLMGSVEENGGTAFIINSENEAGQKLDSLGGMAAMLRYKVTF